MAFTGVIAPALLLVARPRRLEPVGNGHVSTLERMIRNEIRIMSCGTARKALTLVGVLCCILLGACEGQPESSACINHENTLLDIIYNAAAERALALSAENQLTNLSGVRAELKIMRGQNLVQVSGETMSSFDSSSGKASCEAIVHYALPKDDKTPAVAKIIVAVNGTLDIDVTADDPTSSLYYTVEPDANQDGGQVITTTWDETPILLVPIAMARVQAVKGSY